MSDRAWTGVEKRRAGECIVVTGLGVSTIRAPADFIGSDRAKERNRAAEKVSKNDGEALDFKEAAHETAEHEFSKIIESSVSQYPFRASHPRFFLRAPAVC